jgi:hypothetical protein
MIMVSFHSPLSKALSSYRCSSSGSASSHGSSSSTCSRRKVKTPLPANFCPGQYSVLCGRGKICFESTGNNYLKALVSVCLDPYSKAKTKIEKSSIVTAIIARIKELVAASSNSEGAAFVRFKDGLWWHVDDAFAREKIGGLFRDALHIQYRSSTKSKIARKQALQKENRSYADSICCLPLSNDSQHSQLSSYTASFAEEIFSPRDDEVAEDVVSCPLVAISLDPLLLPKAKICPTVPQERYGAGRPQRTDFLRDLHGTMTPLETTSMPRNPIMAVCDLLLDDDMSEIGDLINVLDDCAFD